MFISLFSCVVPNPCNGLECDGVCLITPDGGKCFEDEENSVDTTNHLGSSLAR